MKNSDPVAWLECLVCHKHFEVAPLFSGCPDCASLGRRAALEMRYDYARADLSRPDHDAPGLWRWRVLLPRVRPDAVVSLGEGNTPLVKLRDWAGPASLYLKNETSNPTWSWKDRPNSVSVSMAREFGLDAVVAVSTGNHGNAAAAYSAAGRRRCTVFCHADAPALQLALMRFYGAHVFQGGDRHGKARELVEQGGCFPCASICPRDGYANPYGIEGFKTIAFEVFHQLGSRVPDRVFAPVGSGDGLYGIWKGFVELRRAGTASRTPRMYACQAAGANPYVRAFESRAARLTEVAPVKTVALSIGEPIGGETALQALYESDGGALAVEDPVILENAARLAREGIALEPASATAVACARNLAASAAEGEIWVAVGTGAAVKWPNSLPRME
jgi:threonine synthase